MRRIFLFSAVTCFGIDGMLFICYNKRILKGKRCFMMIKFCVLLLLLIEGAYKIVLSVIRYRSADNPTPASVGDIYDAETYLRWKRYHAEHCRLEIICHSISLAVAFLLLATDAYATVAALFWEWEISAALVLYFLADYVISLFKRYISVMVIEEKYGFNRSTKKTFFTDSVMQAVYEFGLLFILSEFMFLSHFLAGDWMPFVVAVFYFLFSLLLSYMSSKHGRRSKTNTYTPLAEGELKDKLTALLRKYGFRIKAIEVVDASRRTTKLNAYIAGLGKAKTIVLFDNMLQAMDTDEICAVFAHELGHGLHKDILKRNLLNIGYMLLFGAVAYLSVFEPAVYWAFGFDYVDYGFACVLFGIGMGILQPLTGSVFNAVFRRQEYRADAFSANEGLGKTLISALKKMAKDNFTHLSPSPVNVFFEYTHPPIHLRIEAIEQEIQMITVSEKGDLI